LTGEVAANDDLTKTTIKIDAFDRMHPEKYTHVLSFEVSTDRELLADMGQGFSADRRGINFSRSLAGPAGGEETANDSSKTKTEKPSIARRTASLVELAICYDGQEQELARDPVNPNNWTARGPSPGSKITFHLRNTGREKIGTVILVNGYNTLYREYGLDAQQWSRWILAAGKEYQVKGFYKKDGKTPSPLDGILSGQAVGAAGDFADTQGVIEALLFASASGVAARRPANESQAESHDSATQSMGSLRYVPPEQLDLTPPKTWGELHRQVVGNMAFRGGRSVMAADAGDGAMRVDSLESPVHVGTIVVRLFNGASER
jgi:hypothetical protein